MTNKEAMKMAKALWKVIVMRDNLKEDVITSRDINAYENEISRFLNHMYSDFRAELEDKIAEWAKADGIGLESF